MIRTDLILSIPELLAGHASERGGRTAFRDENRTITWAELETRTGRLAGHLRDRVDRGKPIVISMGNCVEAVESYLAITRAGNIGVFIDPRVADAEFTYMLMDSGAETLIIDQEQYERYRRLATGPLPLGEAIVVGEFVQDSGTVDYETLLNSNPGRGPADDLTLDEPAWILYTSGTTGRPKGVMLSQRSCLWVVAACWVPIAGLSGDDYVLSALPLFHSYALDLTVLAIVATGASERLMPRFSPGRVVEVLRSEPITFFTGVPTMYHHILQKLGGQQLDAQALRMCVSAGAIMPGPLNAAFEQASGVPLLDGYGITETSTMVTENWPTGGRTMGSCGLPLPGCAVRLVDPVTGSDVEFGEEGELIVRGPQVMLGYHNRPDDTAAALQGGWYHTGDLARSDSNGYLTITSRIKELIIRGGENIYPAEVEQAIVEHPNVLDAAVIGRSNEALGEVVVAFVVIQDQSLDVDDLLAFVGERIAHFKVPNEVHVINEIPRTGSGKIMRHRLREQLQTGEE